MSLPSLVAIGLGFALTAYAILAGADFGAGILDLTAGHSLEQRTALAGTIGPLWEANHVWLIFSITILFSAFPTGFAALGTVLLAPFTLAVMAIVVRGAAFSLRAEAPGPQSRSGRLLGRAFGAGSVAAPLLFGASAAALAEVSSSAHGPATVSSIPWTGLFAGIVGLLAVALCAHLAATFVANRLERVSQAATDRFRRRGLQTGAAVLALSLLALLAAAWKAPALWHRLSTAGLPVLVIGVLAAVLSLYALASRRYLLARVATMLTAGAIVWGWLIAQSPRLIGARLTIHTAAATHTALAALAIAGAAVLVAVLPAFFLLYILFAHPSPEMTQ